MVGRKLSHYEVIEKIGAGGMGEVYRARDTRLGRDVAIKVLPAGVAQDPERLARFEREAQLLASLNHPNIAAIYGIEEAGGVRYLVLELVPGETLAERIARGPAPVDDALAVCRQIADALEAAHEKGIIHRDLKPANVKVTPGGKVKVLDFGLAKAFDAEISGADLSRSPTLTLGATRAGVILGTAAYMSPEQARGKAADKRADIWAFGCVLYELLTGRQSFSGETVSDAMASILKSEAEWSALPAETPPGVHRLLRRCLQKDPQRRLRDISDARLELEEAEAAPGPPASSAAQRARIPAWLPWSVAAVMVLAAGAVLWKFGRAPQQAERPISRLVIPLAAGDSMPFAPTSVLALSPDGSRLVYAAFRGGKPLLFMRLMDQLEAGPIAGAEGGFSPFFSPDGQWLAFFTPGKLKKVAVPGGVPLLICDAPDGRGGSWLSDDTIVFSPAHNTGLVRVSAAGGTPQVLTSPERQKGETTHRWPEILPDGKTVLFAATAVGRSDDARIEALSLATGQRQTLVKNASFPRFAATSRDPNQGHLLFARSGQLFVVPVRLSPLELAGPAVSIPEAVAINPFSGAMQLSFSRHGNVVYLPSEAPNAERSIVGVDRKGTRAAWFKDRHLYQDLSLSADGRRLAASIQGATNDIWIHEATRDTLTRVTFEGFNQSPVWTPDGRWIAFSSIRGRPPNLFWKAADGSTPEERLTTSDNVHIPGSFSPDGKLLVFTEVHPTTGMDLMVLPLEGDRKPRPFLQTPFSEQRPKLSPDGRWIAYDTDESGRSQICVQPFPGPGGKWQISTDGGFDAVWSAEGREIFYRAEDRVMRVPVSTQPSFSAAKPATVFEGRFEVPRAGSSGFAVAPDGRRFVLIRSEREAAPLRLHVVHEWFQELRRRAPLKE